MNQPPIIVASTSPRRRELLGLLGVPFDVVAPTCEEIQNSSLSPSDQAKQFAKDKAQSVAKEHPEHLVLGSDTVIEIDGTMLGKPEDIHEAKVMLERLRGCVHQVHTAVALIQASTGLSIEFVESAKVWIKLFSEDELGSYLKTNESMGKAGAYSIQGEGAKLIEKIEGDYPTIVGFPLWRVAKALEQQRIALPNPAEEIYQTKPYANWKEFS